MIIESYSFNKLIKSDFTPTLLTDKEVTERIISLQEKHPNNFNFIRIKGSNVPTILYTYDVKLEKLIMYMEHKDKSINKHIMKETTTYIAQEGTERFEFEAKSKTHALII